MKTLSAQRSLEPVSPPLIPAFSPQWGEKVAEGRMRGENAPFSTMARIISVEKFCSTPCYEKKSPRRQFIRNSMLAAAALKTWPLIAQTSVKSNVIGGERGYPMCRRRLLNGRGEKITSRL